MPRLIDFYEDHQRHRDRFEILAFHDGSVKDFAELDSKLPLIIRGMWLGRKLPFPVLLDSTWTTLKKFGVTGFPTMLLIDPEGKLVGRASEQDL